MNMTSLSLENWVRTRPYLVEIGRFQSRIEETLRQFPLSKAPTPSWEPYLEDYRRGIPLLKSKAITLQISGEAGELLLRLLRDTAQQGDVPEGMKRVSQGLVEQLSPEPEKAVQVIQDLLQDKNLGSDRFEDGLLRFFAWTSLSRSLEPFLDSFSLWRQEEDWGRSYCPTCGSLPVMAQLVKSGKGRERFLACGCCKTRWHYKRMGCPYCGNDEQEQLAILEIEQEEDLRIDICKKCNGYLKTYTSEGDEKVALADWSTLHLDVVSRNKGFQRLGTHLYDL